MMSPKLFPTSITVSYLGFDLELMEHCASRYPGLLDSIKQEVVTLAARSRGWQDPASMDLFRRHFKTEGLYAASSLVLIRRQGQLVGLGGAINDWLLDGRSIVHLCSLGLLPTAQNLGFMPALFSLLWRVSRDRPQIQESCERNQTYFTAITQSPYILSFLQRVSDLYPSPYRSIPDADMLAVARAVHARFDHDVPFDPVSFILRNECRFFYRRTPYSTDQRINTFCDQMLRYAEGDVFVLVGRARTDLLDRFVRMVDHQHPELVCTLTNSLPAGSAVVATHADA